MLVHIETLFVLFHVMMMLICFCGKIRDWGMIVAMSGFQNSLFNHPDSVNCMLRELGWLEFGFNANLSK